MMLKKISSGHMVLSMTMGFAVIGNLAVTSRYEFYPFELITGVAFAVGIAMVVGTVIFLMGEPKPMNIKQSFKFPFPASSARVVSGPTNGFHTASRVRVSAA